MKKIIVPKKEIKNLGIEVIDIKKDIIKDNKNEEEKEKEKEKDNNANKIPSKITKKLNKEILTCELNLDDSLNTNEEIKKNKKEEKINISNNNGIIDSKRNESKENNRNILNLQNIQNIETIKINKSKNKVNKNTSKNISINIPSKNLDYIRNNHKLVTLIKDKDRNIRRRLIKNKPKLNIREKTREKAKSKPRVFNSSKKVNKIINFNYFKKRLINRKKAEIAPNTKNIKDNNKKLISKRTNNSKIFQKKYSSKGSINKPRLDYKINAYSNNINNTIDDEGIPKKLKLHFNFHKINISYVNSSKRASSLVRHNMKLTSFETSKTKKIKKNFDSLYENTPSIKKHKI